MNRICKPATLRRFVAYRFARRGYFALLTAGACLAADADQPAGVPSRLLSPNGSYAVEIFDTALPNSDPYESFYTLSLSHGGKVVSKFPTEGYLLNALWSPDGKYVAINNRRGSSGDYVWVLRLRDGKAIKVPTDDAAGLIVERVNQKFPELTKTTFNRRYTLAKKWKSADELVVTTELQFFNLDGFLIRVEETDQVLSDKLKSTLETVEKVAN